MKASILTTVVALTSTLLGACGEDLPNRAPQYTAYQDMRDAIRSSPDHLRSRARDVVQNKNPETIYGFVKDSFQVLPPSEDGLQEMSSKVRWGTSGMLRSGAGTPREATDLLVELLKEAGLSAQAMECEPTIELKYTDAGYQETFLHPIEPVFDPNLDSSDVERYRKNTEDQTISGSVLLDPNGEQRKGLLDRIIQSIDEIGGQRSDWWGLDTIPVVALEYEGERRLLMPWYSPADFGVHYCESEPVALEPAPAPSIKITLAALAPEAEEEIVLVEHEWPANELVGNEVWIQFVTDMDAKTFLQAPFDAPHTFTPALVVRGKTDEEAFVLDTQLGDAFTSYGEMITTAEDGTITIDGHEFGSSEATPGALERVASIETHVRASNFPFVELEVLALDSEGESIEGLIGTSFEIEEDGTPVAARMYRQEPEQPRVLFLLDQSGSIPDEFRGQPTRQVVDDFEASIVAAFPGAEFLVCGVDGCGSGEWEASVSEIQVTDVINNLFGGSDFWGALADVMAKEPTVVLLITDGEFTDALTDDVRRTITEGVPVVTLGVGPVVQETLDLIDEMTGGTSAHVDTPEEALVATNAYLQATDFAPYKLVYRASLEGEASRRVRVGTTESIEGSATYDVPETIKEAGFSGLLLTVEMNGKTVTRTLAGQGGRDDLSPVHRDEVLAQFFGSAFVSFAGYGATKAQMLDEVLTARLSTEHLLDAKATGDLDTMLEAISKGYIQYSGEIEFVQSRTPGSSTGETLTYPDGLRAVLKNIAPRFGTGIIRKLDILPLTDWHTASSDATLSWETTLDKTLYLALAEADAHATNTISKTKDFEWVTTDFGSMPQSLIAAGIDEERAREIERVALYNPGIWQTTYLVPITPYPEAFWSVRRDTGAVLGILLDGSGGASAICEDDAAQRAATLAKVLNSFAGLAGVVPAGLGGWIALGINLHLIGTRAVIILSTLSSDGNPEDTEDLAKTLQEDLEKAIAGAATGGLAGLHPLSDVLNATKGIFEDLAALLKAPPAGC